MREGFVLLIALLLAAPFVARAVELDDTEVENGNQERSPMLRIDAQVSLKLQAKPKIVDGSVVVHAGDSDAIHPLIVIPATRVCCWYLNPSHSLFHPRLT